MINCEKSYKKSYKGFGIWMIGFCVALVGAAFLPIEDTALMTRVVCNVSIFGIVLLAYIIYKTEYVYWYNGTSYEEAVEAGSERRKEFALKHLRKFEKFALLFLLFSIIMHIFKVTIGFDLIVATVGLVVAAVGTMDYKL